MCGACVCGGACFLFLGGGEETAYVTRVLGEAKKKSRTDFFTTRLRGKKGFLLRQEPTPPHLILSHMLMVVR